MEVGTKQQSLGHKKEAYKLFDQSYELYCLFWGLNMKLLNLEDVKWIEDSFDDVKKLTKELTQPVEVAEEKKEEVKEEVPASEDKNTFSKIKAFVRKAVDCCIE